MKYSATIRDSETSRSSATFFAASITYESMRSVSFVCMTYIS